MKQRSPQGAHNEPTFSATEQGDLAAVVYPERSAPTRHRGSTVVAWGFVVILFVALGFMALLGFEPLKQQLHATQTLLSEANRNVASLQRQVSLLEAYRGDLQKERDGLAHQVQQREAEVAVLQTATQQLNEIFATDIDRGNILVRQMEGELVVDVANDVLFGSGDAVLTQGGQFILRKIAGVLSRLAGRTIEVGGHTDTQPLAARLVHQYFSNWEMSCARAAEVVRFLEEFGGIAGDHLVAAGYAGTRPMAKNDHAPGRRRNQRIELVVQGSPQAATLVE